MDRDEREWQTVPQGPGGRPRELRQVVPVARMVVRSRLAVTMPAVAVYPDGFDIHLHLDVLVGHPAVAWLVGSPDRPVLDRPPLPIPEERSAFVAFLDALPGPFWVVRGQSRRGSRRPRWDEHDRRGPIGMAPVGHGLGRLSPAGNRTAVDRATPSLERDPTIGRDDPGGNDG